MIYSSYAIIILSKSKSSLSALLSGQTLSQSIQMTKGYPKLKSIINYYYLTLDSAGS
ncbi:hypothetical protein CLOLEP_00047 [[Clostridium] leptum DSM 753]|uniref:Uncharacterized protein n=1 Tax=[Clostridium] leptum DSM 753 TaxID=428125 RepID=A7VNC3_9FIRM|nr:hypothetical protein CLOLEP_00047 [[Clostridium] leptum DSM 753]